MFPGLSITVTEYALELRDVPRDRYIHILQAAVGELVGREDRGLTPGKSDDVRRFAHTGRETHGSLAI